MDGTLLNFGSSNRKLCINCEGYVTFTHCKVAFLHFRNGFSFIIIMHISEIVRYA